MSGQADQLQPGGQKAHRPELRIGRRRPEGWVGLALAFAALAFPFNRGGLWDPHELRVAELARRLAHQLFAASGGPLGSESLTLVTRGQLGQGELGITSPALGFAIFGLSDWSGRITSLFWGGVAIVALWFLLGRLADRLAQGAGVIALVSFPLFVWQARSMLGDAATMGTLALSTAGLALAVFDQTSSGACRTSARQLFYWTMALCGLGAGVLCRGILCGVAVPCLAIGLVALWSPPSELANARKRVVPVTLVSIGCIAATIGVREFLVAPEGFSFLLGATLATPVTSEPFDLPVTRLIHQLFPFGAFIPFACIIAMKPGLRTPRAPRSGSGLALALNLSCVLSLANAALMTKRGVVVPFPAVAALAGVSGIAISGLHQRAAKVGLLGVFVLSITVVVFADFVNFPEKAMLMTGISAAQFPHAFETENQSWLRIALGISTIGCVLHVVAARLPRPRDAEIRAAFTSAFVSLRSAFGGQLISGLVLVETALVTTALLQRAHDQHWITVPAFDSMRSLVGSALTWVWLVPPMLLFALPICSIVVDRVVGWVTDAPWCSFWRVFRQLARCIGISGLVATQPVRARLSPGLVLGAGLAASGLVVTVGHAPALAEQLSPKRAISQYRAHAKGDEQLALVGIKPEGVGFYLDQTPLAFQDIELAARWLNESGERRRWLSFDVDRFSEINAAFRAASGRHNLVLLEPISSNLVVATNRLLAMESDHNPVRLDVLNGLPPFAVTSDVTFGNALRLVGWDVISAAGLAVTTLRPGQSYELRLVFEVFATTSIDWDVFVHIDGRGKRHNGDHSPVGGRYPTTLWQPGDVIVDRHNVVLERGTFVGAHNVFMGLFRGNKRLEVTSGVHDDNRVKLGELLVQ